MLSVVEKKAANSPTWTRSRLQLGSGDLLSASLKVRQDPNRSDHGNRNKIAEVMYRARIWKLRTSQRPCDVLLQFYGSVTDEVAEPAREEAFAKYSWL
jgi:hypothetical protein